MKVPELLSESDSFHAQVAVVSAFLCAKVILCKQSVYDEHYSWCSRTHIQFRVTHRHRLGVAMHVLCGLGIG